MKFTTKSRYALDALIDLYSRTSLEPVKISEIAVNQSIEMNYLEQLFRKLRIAGLLKLHAAEMVDMFLLWMQV